MGVEGDMYYEVSQWHVVLQLSVVSQSDKLCEKYIKTNMSRIMGLIAKQAELIMSHIHFANPYHDIYYICIFIVCILLPPI